MGPGLLVISVEELANAKEDNSSVLEHSASNRKVRMEKSSHSSTLIPEHAEKEYVFVRRHEFVTRRETL